LRLFPSKLKGRVAQLPSTFKGSGVRRRWRIFHDPPYNRGTSKDVPYSFHDQRVLAAVGRIFHDLPYNRGTSKDVPYSFMNGASLLL
jgi:hypothetical protein